MSESSQRQPRPFNYNPARSQHRSRSHDEAHSEETGEPVQTLKHADVPAGDVPMITTQPALEEFLQHARALGSFTYDSEFIGELTYVPKLCLIQASTRERIALIDPLVGLDLNPFWEIICDPAVEKVVHAGQQDLEPVIRHLGRRPANIIDTQIVAAFIGMAYPVSLFKLVRELLGVRLLKGMTFTHWDQRPLSPSQLRYAADDVRYLPALWSEIKKRLEATGHLAWAREECESLCDPALYRFDPETQYLRVRGASSLQPAGLAILRALTVWRDTASRSHNIPPRAFLKDEILIDMSRSPVKSVEKLERVRGLPRPVEAAHGAEIVEATLQALQLPPEKMPATTHVEETPFDEFAADALWAACECVCIGRSIAPSLVASRADIARLYRHIVKGEPVQQDNRLLNGWRREAITDSLINLLKNDARIQLSWHDGRLHAV